MVVLSILTFLCAAGICHGKAFPEGTSNSRGKRVYDHDRFGEHFPPFYESQSNEEGLYYYPKIDGRPIYIPALDQPASHMKELLDNYYRPKDFTHTRLFTTPVPHDYDISENSYYENSVTSNSMIKNILHETNDGHRGNYHILPTTTRSNLNYKFEVRDGIKHDIDNYGNKNFDTSQKLPDLEYIDKDPIVYETDKQHKNNVQYGKVSPKFQKTKSEMEYVEYEQPVVRKTIKQNLDPSNIKYNKGQVRIPHTKSDVEYINEYETPVIRKIVKENMHTSNVNYEKEQSSFPSTKSVLEYEDYYEQPVVHSVSKQEKIKMKPKQNKKRIPSGSNYESTFQTTHATRNKSKGKRRKHPLISKNYETTSEYTTSMMDVKNILESNTVDESFDEFYRKKIDESQEYGIGNYKIKVSDGKLKGTVQIKSEQKKHPAKIKESVPIKSEHKEHPVEVKEKVVKPESEEHHEKVVKPESEEHPVKIVEKIAIIPGPKKHLVKSKVEIKSSKPKIDVTETISKSDEFLKPEDIFETNKGTFIDDSDTLLTDELTDFTESIEDKTDGNFLEYEVETEPDAENFWNVVEPFNAEENQLDFENAGSGTIARDTDSTNSPKFLPVTDAIENLSSLNSNIWSLVFNPNAERFKQNKCITRSNETGFCTYIQHCEVPNIANSLEKLLNNACVIDDVFIGVCCPEFPVETVKVHWEQTTSDSDIQLEDEFVQNVKDCGKRSNEASKLKSWPWKAPLVSMSNGKIFCGGVVISNDYVLTAAHCTTKIPRNQILVRLGQYDHLTGDDFAVVEIKRHAQYNPRTMLNDIALLKLGRRITHDTHSGVICLPEDEGEDNEDDHSGERATLLGWRGIFGTKSEDPEILEVMSNDECEKKLGMKVTPAMLCTETRNENERTCNADSGAPLVIEDDGKYEVIGILSWNRNDCNPRFPSTFSRVSSYVGWIQKHSV